MSKQNLRFVVYSLPYRDGVGGIIVLHKLCATLASLGYEVVIWNSLLPSPHQKGLWKNIRNWSKYLFKRAFRPRDFDSPHGIRFANKSHLDAAVVVYPETVKGNPLQAKKVVRWLLNTPGVVSGSGMEFSASELICYFSENFMSSSLPKEAQIHLNVVDFKRQVYQQRNHAERTGCCYMVRKGAERTLDQHPQDAICIDGLSHEKTAAIFNQYKYFLSYDLYTAYSRYAAMCGCVPLVVPKANMNKQQWRPEPDSRLGIAYGWDDLTWAEQSRNDLLNFLDQSEVRNLKMVKAMVRAVRARFF